MYAEFRSLLDICIYIYSLFSGYQTFKEITNDETRILNYEKGIIKTINSENRHTLKIIGSCKFNATIHTTCNISIEIPITFMITKESPIIPVIIGMNTIIRNRIADILHNKILRIQGYDVTRTLQTCLWEPGKDI